MTPFRSHGKGTLVLSGYPLEGVRLERASGTNDPKRLEEPARDVPHARADSGRLDVLEQLSDGHLKVLEVWRHYRAGDWSKLPTAEHLKPFAECFEAWRRTVPGDRHRKDLALAGKQLGAAGRAQSAVADLPRIVALLRERYAARGAARHFNKLRDAASAFLKQTVTRQIPLYLAVRAVEPLTSTRHRPHHPKDPSEAWVIAQTLGGEAGRLWWAMCATGMGPKELWYDGFRVEDGHLRILGQKRRARHRLTPLILDALEPPLVGHWGFASALRRSGLGVTPYDARRSFARWLEEAGILETHQQAYLGHGPKTITDLYRRAEIVVDMVDADATRLATYVRDKLVGFSVGSESRRRETGRVSDDETAMTRAGLEPATYGLKVRCSTN